MRTLLKITMSISIITLITGCSSDDVEKAVDVANAIDGNSNPQQQADDYNSDKYKPFGLFAGDLASSGEETSAIMLADKTTSSYFFYTVEGIISGEFESDNGDRFTSKNAKAFKLNPESLLNLVWRKNDEDDDIILSYTFDAAEDFEWEISRDNNDTLISFPQNSNIASDIKRFQPAPSSPSIISGQYVIQHRGSVLPAYNMTVELTQDRKITGVDSDGCLLDGTYNAGNENLNIYQIDLTVSSCELDGDYSGLASVTGISDSLSTGILVIVASNTSALIFTASAN